MCPFGACLPVDTERGTVTGKAVTIGESGILIVRLPTGEEVEVADGTVREPA